MENLVALRSRWVEMAVVGQLLPANELGFTICRASNGQLIRGPVTRGTPTSVSISVQCPENSTFLGLFHTHPRGVSFPSAQDIESALQVNAPMLCIQSEREGLKCFRIQREG